MQQQVSQKGIISLPINKRLFISFSRFFFKLLYHNLAWMYDWVASIVSLGEWQNWVRSVMPDIEGRRILEIGFGPGHLLEALDKKNSIIVGLDESPQMIGIARHRLSRSGGHYNLIRGIAQALPFTNETFNQVVMTFPADFILTASALQEIYRVLGCGGKAIIIPMAWLTGRTPMARFMAWINRITGEAPDWDEAFLDPIRGIGFDVSWEMRQLRSSKLLVVYLARPGNK